MKKNNFNTVNTTCGDLRDATNRVVAEQECVTTNNEGMETSMSEPSNLIEKEMEKDFSKVSNAAGSDLGGATNRVVAEQECVTTNNEGMETSMSEPKELRSEEMELKKKEALIEKMREDAKKTTSIKNIYLGDDGSIMVKVARVPLYSYRGDKYIGMSERQESYLQSLVDYQSNCNIRKVNKYAASKIIDMVKKYEIVRRDIYVYC